MVFSTERLFLSLAIMLTGLMTDFTLFTPQQLGTPCFFLHKSQQCRTPPSLFGVTCAKLEVFSAFPGGEFTPFLPNSICHI